MLKPSLSLIKPFCPKKNENIAVIEYFIYSYIGVYESLYKLSILHF